MVSVGQLPLFELECLVRRHEGHANRVGAGTALPGEPGVGLLGWGCFHRCRSLAGGFVFVIRHKSSFFLLSLVLKLGGRDRMWRRRAVTQVRAGSSHRLAFNRIRYCGVHHEFG